MRSASLFRAILAGKHSSRKTLHAVARCLRGAWMRPVRGMAQSGSASALGVEGLRLKTFVKNKKSNLFKPKHLIGAQVLSSV